VIVIKDTYRESMSSRIDLALLDRIGRSIDHDGIVAVPAHLLTDVAHEAVRLGVQPVLAGVLSSSAHPSVARERAYGAVASAIASAYTVGAPARAAGIAA